MQLPCSEVPSPQPYGAIEQRSRLRTARWFVLWAERFKGIEKMIDVPGRGPAMLSNPGFYASAIIGTLP